MMMDPTHLQLKWFTVPKKASTYYHFVLNLLFIQISLVISVYKTVQFDSTAGLGFVKRLLFLSPFRSLFQIP